MKRKVKNTRVCKSAVCFSRRPLQSVKRDGSSFPTPDYSTIHRRIKAEFKNEKEVNKIAHNNRWKNSEI